MELALTEERDTDGRTWLQEAACRGREPSSAFYPPMHHETRDERARREDRAKTVCAACPVQAACRDYALSTREPFGIWGGLTENERKTLLATAG